MNKLRAWADNSTRVVIIIFVVAVVVRLIFALWIAPHIPQLDQQVASDQGLRISRNLVAGQGYKMTFAGLEYYSFRPPTFPLFLAGVIWLFGDSFTVLALAMSALGGLTAVLVYLLAKDLYRSPVPLLAGTISCFYPTFLYITGTPISENLAIPLLVALMLFLLRLRRTGKPLYLLLSGILLGLMVLCRTIYLPFTAVIAAWLLLVYEDKRQACRHTAILAAIVVAMLIPWIARNYNVHHRFVPTTTDGGLVLFFSNNPEILKNPADTELTSYYANLTQLRSMDEIERDHWFYREGFKSIRENLGLYLQRIIVRMWRLWKPYPSVERWRIADIMRAALMFTTYTPLFMFFIVGVWISRNKWKDLAIFYALFIYLTLISSLIHSVIRYRAPLEPFILIIGTAGFCQLLSWLKAKRAHYKVTGQEARANI